MKVWVFFFALEYLQLFYDSKLWLCWVEPSETLSMIIQFPELIINNSKGDRGENHILLIKKSYM